VTSDANWQEQLMRVFDRVDILSKKHGPPETHAETVALIKPMADRIQAGVPVLAATQRGTPEREEAVANQFGMLLEFSLILMKALESAPDFHRKKTEAAIHELMGSEQMQKEIDKRISPSMNQLARITTRSGFIRGLAVGILAGATFGVGSAFLGFLAGFHHWF
jgi:hypothetical protein